MATKAQITANRRNAHQSTGPKTPKGKTTVSQNAVKHGLTAQKTPIPGENRADFALYHYEMLEELNPLSPMESMLADRIVSLSWRLKRAVRIQEQTMEVLCTPKIVSTFDKFLLNAQAHYDPDVEEAFPLGRVAIEHFSNSSVLERLMMYERRIENSLYKTMHELQKLTLTRKQGPPAAPQPKTTSQPPIPAQPITNMQNKPNSQNAKTNLNSYAQNNYEHNPPLRSTPKETEANAILRPVGRL